MPYYHATRTDRLDSIRANGLDPHIGAQNFDCVRGVYLAEDIHVAAGIMTIHWLQADAALVDTLRGFTPLSPTREVARVWNKHEQTTALLDSVIVFVIDDARIDRALLEPDPNGVAALGCYRYTSTIDVTGLTIVTLDDLARKAAVKCRIKA